MGKTVEEKLAGLSAERRAKIAAQTAALTAEEKSFCELRVQANSQAVAPARRRASAPVARETSACGKEQSLMHEC